jgi:hypothetical protein
MLLANMTTARMVAEAFPDRWGCMAEPYHSDSCLTIERASDGLCSSKAPLLMQPASCQRVMDVGG